MYENQRTHLEFPCNFPIKVMGRANLDFEAKILSILRKHSPDLGEAAIKIRHSKEGTFMSITAMIPAKSKQQLDAIYQELTAEEMVMVVL
jgi:uncharacterized protein